MTVRRKTPRHGGSLTRSDHSKPRLRFLKVPIFFFLRPPLLLLLHKQRCREMEAQEDMRLLGGPGPKLNRERSDISTWDWAESGWDEEVGVILLEEKVSAFWLPRPAPHRLR